MRGTFHAFANHLLRRYAVLLDLHPNFSVIDTTDSEDALDLVRTELKLGEKNKAFPRKQRLQEIISKVRNGQQTLSEVLEADFVGLVDYEKDIERVANAYRQYKRLNRLLDYDDLMELLRDALRDHPIFRQEVQRLYRYVMVDEFQDTNLLQKEIVDLVAARSRNIMVVGDDSQSIYAFRGANFENILTFPETYPDCRVVKLEQNYRSNQHILAFINDIAKQAALGYHKHLYSANENDVKPLLAKFFDQQSEAEFIVNRILELREKNIPLNQIAVLYRSSYHGNFVQAELLRRNIPYVVVGGIKFVERSHVKDVLSYLRIIANPFDGIAWNRVLKLVPGVGNVTAGKIIDYLSQHGHSLNFAHFEGKKFSKELLKLGEMLTAIRPDRVGLPAKLDIIKAYYAPILQSRETDATVRLQDLEVIYTLSNRYQTVPEFLADFVLDPPSNKFQESNRPLIDESEDPPLTLSTIHSAKGLEWYAVFVPHLLDGLFPAVRSMQHLEQLEEERRLFYVACSRAEEALYLTLPAFFAGWDANFTMPSRFLAEVGKDKYDIWEA